MPDSGFDDASHYTEATDDKDQHTEDAETYEAVVQQEDIQAMKRVIKALQSQEPASEESRKDRKKKRRRSTRSRSRRAKSRRKSPTTQSSPGPAVPESPEPILEDGYLLLDPEDVPAFSEAPAELYDEDDEFLAGELERCFGH